MVPSPDTYETVKGYPVSFATEEDLEALDHDMTRMAKAFADAAEAFDKRIVEQSDHMLVQWVVLVIVAVIAVLGLILPR
jgi:hypothetical protein